MGESKKVFQVPPEDVCLGKQTLNEGNLLCPFRLVSVRQLEVVPPKKTFLGGLYTSSLSGCSYLPDCLLDSLFTFHCLS